jgi:acetyl esterase/lipase
MYPVGFRWPEPLYRSFDVSELLVRTAIENTPDRVIFFGPTEFRIFRMEESNVWAASNALLCVREAAIPPESVLVFRPWVEKRVASSQKEVMVSKGKNAGVEHAEETVYVAHLEVIHPSTQEMLIELALEASVDPFAIHTQEGDPTPEATVLLQHLVREALKMVQPHTQRHEFQGWPKHRFVPMNYLQKSDEAEQSLRMRFASIDGLDVELLKLSRLQFFNSQAQEGDLNGLGRSPGGIWLRQKHSPFDDGDLIQTINGRPVNMALFHRALRGVGKSKIEGRKRDGTSFKLEL